MSNTVRTTIFKSNKSQAVRLPKAVEMPKNVEIVAQGNKRIISPVGAAWVAWFEGEGVSYDFMDARDQPTPQTRESFEYKEH
ncbi:MAG: type II toxin-antitoxin system VapB family antitoxin [Pseudomonadota bacterium]